MPERVAWRAGTSTRLRARIARAGCRTRLKNSVLRSGAKTVMARSSCALRRLPAPARHAATPQQRVTTYDGAKQSLSSSPCRECGGAGVGGARIKSEPLRHARFTVRKVHTVSGNPRERSSRGTNPRVAVRARDPRAEPTHAPPHPRRSDAMRVSRSRSRTPPWASLNVRRGDGRRRRGTPAGDRSRRQTRRRSPSSPATRVPRGRDNATPRGSRSPPWW
jgi:hypothetical protein